MENCEENTSKQLHAAASLLDELYGLLAPKCDSELTKLFNEYDDIQVLTRSLLDEAVTTLVEYNDTYTTYLERYENVNLTLSMVSTMGTVGQMLLWWM